MENSKSNWISQALAQGRSNAKWLESDDTKGSTDDQSETEFLLAIGKVVQSRLRRGQEIESLTSILRCHLETLFVAREFSISSPALIFKALMEDWSLGELRNAVCPSGNCFAVA